MPTVSELIHSSFRLIGAIAAGETLETAELNDAFVSLNQLIASWNTEGLSLAGRQLVVIGLQIGVNQYSYPLQAWPVRIEAASVAAGGVDWPLEIVDSSGWAAIPETAMQAIMAKKLFCDYLYPDSTVRIWPTPRAGGSLNLWVYAQIVPFAALTEVINLPPGYEMALRYNFAIAILPEYPRSQVDPTLLSQAQNYKASIVQMNSINHVRSQGGTPPPAAVERAV